MNTQLIDPYEYTQVVKSLRSFFDSKSFQEVHTQNRLSILAACEDPTTVATYEGLRLCTRVVETTFPWDGHRDFLFVYFSLLCVQCLCF